MTVQTGRFGVLDFTATADQGGYLFESASGSHPAKIDQQWLEEWTLVTQREMVDVTPTDVEHTEYHPAGGHGMCLVRGWVAAESDNTLYLPVRYNNTAATVKLYIDVANAGNNKYYQFDGMIETFNLISHVDAPNRFTASVRITTDITITWDV